MDTTDVDSTADRAQERYTSHLFDESLEQTFKFSGSAARVPSDMSIWPPAALFDAVYASAVLRNFGTTGTEISEKWEDVFYYDGFTKVAHPDDRRRRVQADADKENSNMQDAARQQRYERRNRRRNVMDPFDLVMMYPFREMGPENVAAYFKGCEEVVAAREQKRLEEKVNSWRESLAPLNTDDELTSASRSDRPPLL